MLRKRIPDKIAKAYWRKDIKKFFHSTEGRVDFATKAPPAEEMTFVNEAACLSEGNLRRLCSDIAGAAIVDKAIAVLSKCQTWFDAGPGDIPSRVNRAAENAGRTAHRKRAMAMMLLHWSTGTCFLFFAI